MALLAAPIFIVTEPMTQADRPIRVQGRDYGDLEVSRSGDRCKGEVEGGVQVDNIRSSGLEGMQSIDKHKGIDLQYLVQQGRKKRSCRESCLGPWKLYRKVFTAKGEGGEQYCVHGR